MFYTLLTATILFSVVVLVCIKTMGLQINTIHMQQQEAAQFSKFTTTLIYHKWLITHCYDMLLKQLQEPKDEIVIAAAFDSYLYCKKGNTSSDLNLKSTGANNSCYWRAVKEGGRFVFSGYTFTSV